MLIATPPNWLQISCTMLGTSVGKTVSLLSVLVNTIFGLPLCYQAEVMHCDNGCLHHQLNDGISACYSLSNTHDIMQQANCHILPSFPDLPYKQVLLLAAVCEIILPGPEAAARAAAAAPNKKRNEAEAAIADAVSRALHMLGSLKQIVSLVAG